MYMELLILHFVISVAITYAVSCEYNLNFKECFVQRQLSVNSTTIL